mgnify:FL=1
MPRITRLLLIACLALAPLTGARATNLPQPLTAKEAQRELRILKRGLGDLHAGLYRYQTHEQFEAEFARAEAQVADGSDAMEMYLIASRIAAAVRCGHTWTNPVNQSPAVQRAFSALPALPLRVRVLENRLLVTASVDPTVPVNAELLAIDGRTSAALIADFMPYLRADGGNDGKRLSQLDSNENGGAMDRLLPLLHAPGTGGYTLRMRPRGGKVRTVTVAAMTAGERERRLIAAGNPMPGTDWRFEIDGNAATLTLPTFAFWNGGFDWNGFLDRSFATLEEKNIPNLILDLRQNEGGDDAIGRALMAHLIPAPLTIAASRAETAYERAPYDLVRYLDTWDFSFFDRTGQVVRGEGRNWRLREQASLRLSVPMTKP